MKLKFIEYILG